MGFMSFLREHAQILRRSGPLALVFLMIAALNDQFINSRLEMAMLSDSGPGLSVAILAAASLLNSLVFPTLAALVLYYGLAKSRGTAEDLPHFLRRVVNQVYVETLRSWGATLAWGLLLILPGLLRLLQLIYVPLVVIFLKPYEDGQADALKVSTRYANRRPFRLLGFVLLFSLLIPLTVTSLTDPWRTYSTAPVGALLCTILDLLLLTLFVQILFRLFDRLRQEFGDESLLPMDRHSLAGSRTHV